MVSPQQVSAISLVFMHNLIPYNYVCYCSRCTQTSSIVDRQLLSVSQTIKLAVYEGEQSNGSFWSPNLINHKWTRCVWIHSRWLTCKQMHVAMVISAENINNYTEILFYRCLQGLLQIKKNFLESPPTYEVASCPHIKLAEAVLKGASQTSPPFN